jgi:hypothetical protein
LCTLRISPLNLQPFYDLPRPQNFLSRLVIQLGLKQKCSFLRKLSRKVSVLWHFLRKFSMWNADPDSGATWMCIQIRNIGWKFLQKRKFFIKTIAGTTIFREKLKFSQKLVLNQKFLPKQKKFSWTLSRKLLQKQKTSFIFAFRENEKRLFFRFNPNYICWLF